MPALSLAGSPLRIRREATGGGHPSRERFFLEISDFTPEEQEQLIKAQQFSDKYHAQQRRADGAPYMNHIFRVVIRIMHHYQVKDLEVILAALLHDVVEDQAKAITGIDDKAAAKEPAFGVIAAEFGPGVEELVRAVSNPEFEGEDWHEQYREHVIHLLKTNPRAGIIKISDFTDNATGIHYTPAGKAESC
jgi:(p)ppGpp synthase/HD superfamily hydrolase